jgi:KipI family sensor histidine kinase inhibitor
MQEHPAPRYANQGDAALLVYLGQGIDPLLNRRVRALAAALAQTPLAGVREVLGCYHCLQVQFDPARVEPAEIQLWAAETLAALPELAEETPRVVEVPVAYGGAQGPDLEFVARHSGLKPQEVIDRHSGRDHPCYVVGFSPAFPFLGGMDPALACPRLDSPRLDVPPGSVGIGGAQTGLYTIGGPGGWRLIGRTTLLVYDPRRDPPGLIRAGDQVRFKATHAADFPEIPQAKGSLPEPGHEVLEVLKPGAFTTVQDRGRWGYQFQGVPVCGALDQTALAAANILVGNHPEAAALELTLLGPKLKALAPLKIALAGADLAPLIDGKPLPLGRAVQMQPGQVLDFKGPKGGARAVLAIEGGVWSPLMMGSRSVYPLGRLGKALQKGQRIAAGSASGLKGPDGLPAGLIPPAQSPAEIRVLAGPNLDYFTDESLDTFFSADFQLSQETDRRGMRLIGPQVELDPEMPDSILSEPNTPGVIQVPPGGQPIIQLNEQTVGGYAKIATVISADLDILARLLPGSRLSFRQVSLDEAVEAAKARSRALASLANQA